MRTAGPISSQADYRTRFPRNQQEAGIHLMEWADRLPPSRSYLRDIAEGAGILAIVISIFILCLAAVK
jgi:hypothetical protein